ncbi:hypothetical protein [Pseudorhizobium flavum]|uniref:hypothetical protein n=1 Tax=Pseudorhizobium flavum TaxID=1335061 RepID=UPI0037703D00
MKSILRLLSISAFAGVLVAGTASAVEWPADWKASWSEDDPEIQILGGEPTLDDFKSGRPKDGYSLLPEIGIHDNLVIISAAHLKCERGTVSPVVLNAARMEHAKLQKIHFDDVPIEMNLAASMFLGGLTDFQRSNLCKMAAQISSENLEAAKQQIMREVWRQENGKAPASTRGASLGITR